jgi:hypothetical protein
LHGAERNCELVDLLTQAQQGSDLPGLREIGFIQVTPVELQNCLFRLGALVVGFALWEGSREG